MAEYIDVTSLKKQIADFKRAVNSPNSDYMTGYLSAVSVTEGIIASIPTTDVVEVVRCKDCKRVSLYCGSYKCYNPQTPWFNDEFNIDVGADDFCSYGERKESEVDTE